MLDTLRTKGFELKFLSHAAAILATDFPQALADLEQALAGFQIPITEIIGGGGGEAGGTQRLRRSLADLGWKKTNFEIRKTINGEERESRSHEVDHVKGFEVDGKTCNVALEIEWNNKDPFFDRDLENFKRLHAEGAISLGVIVTRGGTLQDGMLESVKRFALGKRVVGYADLAPFGISPTNRQRDAVERCAARGEKPFAECWAEHFVSDKFGAATTHWRKLLDRVDRGVGNPCPLLLIGLPAGIVTF